MTARALHKVLRHRSIGGNVHGEFCNCRGGRMSRPAATAESITVSSHRQSRDEVDHQEVELLRHLWRFREKFRESRDVHKLIRAALRIGQDHFHTTEACLATIEPRVPRARIEHSTSGSRNWDAILIGHFLRGERVDIPLNLMLARLRRRGRMWGALALRHPRRDFHWQSRQAFSMIADSVNEQIDRIERQRVTEVRWKIDQKILEQVKPKHLFYKLLHGIRSLTEYDHSAALLMCNRDRRTLEVVAEQIAWHKGKSENVGLTMPLDDEVRQSLRTGDAFGFDRVSGQWEQWSGLETPALAELLDYNPTRESDLYPAAEHSLLCVPLVTRDGLLGALKIAARHAGTMREYELELLQKFLPQAAVALQNLHRTESLENQVIEAERRSAMAELARGVAHDVNNALGSVIPLVQQMRVDLDEGLLSKEETQQDLDEIEKSMQVCRRIFHGMLSLARNESRNASEVSLAVVIESALAVFRQNLDRRAIQLQVHLPPNMPTIRAIQGDIEQLLLNLVGNARDATDAGDLIEIRVDRELHWLKLTVKDSGCGMPSDHLAKAQEPFFTTKSNGNGLGLAISRSIVAQLRGQFQIESAEQKGTSVTIRFPLKHH